MRFYYYNLNLFIESTKLLKMLDLCWLMYSRISSHSNHKFLTSIFIQISCFYVLHIRFPDETYIIVSCSSLEFCEYLNINIFSLKISYVLIIIFVWFSNKLKSLINLTKIYCKVVIIVFTILFCASSFLILSF